MVLQFVNYTIFLNYKTFWVERTILHICKYIKFDQFIMKNWIVKKHFLWFQGFVPQLSSVCTWIFIPTSFCTVKFVSLLVIISIYQNSLLQPSPPPLRTTQRTTPTTPLKNESRFRNILTSYMSDTICSALLLLPRQVTKHIHWLGHWSCYVFNNIRSIFCFRR